MIEKTQQVSRTTTTLTDPSKNLSLIIERTNEGFITKTELIVGTARVAVIDGYNLFEFIITVMHVEDMLKEFIENLENSLDKD